MGARKNRPGKHGTGDSLNSREREFVLRVFCHPNTLIQFDEKLGTVYYFQAMDNGYGDVVRGLITRGMIEVVLASEEPDYVTGKWGRPDPVLGLTVKGREVWASIRSEKPADPLCTEYLFED